GSLRTRPPDARPRPARIMRFHPLRQNRGNDAAGSPEDRIAPWLRAQFFAVDAPPFHDAPRIRFHQSVPRFPADERFQKTQRSHPRLTWSLAKRSWAGRSPTPLHNRDLPFTGVTRLLHCLELNAP